MTDNYFPLKFTGRQELFSSTDIRQPSSYLCSITVQKEKKSVCETILTYLKHKYGLLIFFNTFRASRCFICGQHFEISDVENLMVLPRVQDEKGRGLACNINPLIISPFLKAVKLPP